MIDGFVDRMSQSPWPMIGPVRPNDIVYIQHICRWWDQSKGYHVPVVENKRVTNVEIAVADDDPVHHW